jgi:hypothetical protein
MPYSSCVPKIFNEIKEFVNNCVKFAEGLNSSQTELDDMVRKPTNRLITDKLKENISSLIQDVTLAQVILVNLNTRREYSIFSPLARTNCRQYSLF